MLVSTDGGYTYFEAYRSELPSTIGVSETDLLEEDPEYIGSQTLQVLVNFPLSSINSDQLLKNQNRCVIGDECIQYKTATLLAMVDGKYSYRLSGIIRGRYGSASPNWPSGTRFVLMDETVIFAPVSKSILNQDVTYKPVSFGLTDDETVPTDYLFDDPVSQKEWKPSHVNSTVLS